MNKHLSSSICSVLAVVFCTIAFNANAEGFGKLRGARENADGGITAGKLSRGKGPEAGGFVRGRRTKTDDQGNAVTKSGAAFESANGATGYRRGETTKSADGSVSHQGQMEAAGAKGEISSEGSYSKNADGTASGERNTSVTSTNGSTYNGNTTYNKGEGITHTGACADAGGNPIECPSR